MKRREISEYLYPTHSLKDSRSCSMPFVTLRPSAVLCDKKPTFVGPLLASHLLIRAFCCTSYSTFFLSAAGGTLEVMTEISFCIKATSCSVGALYVQNFKISSLYIKKKARIRLCC